MLHKMHKEAEQIVDNSLKLRHVAEGKLRDRLRQIQSNYRRQSRGYKETLPDTLAIMAEISDRTLGLRPYPVQILGAMALYRGYLTEMATGEGKSLTACYPAILAAWTGKPCHIITANDYLAGRDSVEMRPLYSFCGVSVGWVSSEMETGERRINYEKGVVYTTSKEILADFLRDRLKLGLCHQPSRRLIRQMLQPRIREGEGLVMRGLDTAIVDEADSVLIDEAVTPLIISHPQENAHLLEACSIAQEIAETLTAPLDYSTEVKYREIVLTTSGRERIEDLAASLPGLWRGTARREELIIQALAARELYCRDKQYVVQNGKVVIVDEFTGRLMPNRTWKHGLHQAVEAMEGLEMSDPSETLARLSFQRFFRFFRKLSGMTGTAGEAAAEFWYIYGLPVMTIPTHRPCIRKMFPGNVFSNQEKKWEAIRSETVRLHKSGRPVLVGTRNIKASERLAAMLSDQGLTFRLLNAVRHKEEAAIVAVAGKLGAITIATNMAGRGTDIKLGGGVAKLGGLHVIATERHESSRIDRQLFGRCARQGDPGSTQAFMCIEDELIQRFVPAPICRWLSSAVEKGLPGTQSIAQHSLSYAQKAAQRLAFRQRRGVLKIDTWLADALSFTGSSVER
jgi:preprotein translocase subunit SecA